MAFASSGNHPLLPHSQYNASPGSFSVAFDVNFGSTGSCHASSVSFAVRPGDSQVVVFLQSDQGHSLHV